jgi:hypothetical protein
MRVAIDNGVGDNRPCETFRAAVAPIRGVAQPLNLPLLSTKLAARRIGHVRIHTKLRDDGRKGLTD